MPLNLSPSRFWIVPFVLTLSVLCGAQAPQPEPTTDQETELGQEMYKELRAKGEIVESSPLYVNEIEDFARVVGGLAPPRVTLADSRGNVATLAALLASAGAR